jgi:hypothetical protein
MRQIVTKYDGTCRKCGADLVAGSPVIYEKRVGIFCLSCGPTETEEVREYRQEAADRRADKLDEWAQKRVSKANTQLNSYPSLRNDYAFVTQPGHIPLRARMIKADEKAYESLKIARDMAGKAENLRHVRVAGDAERDREARREETRQWIKVGMMVFNSMFGKGRVLRINKKTATIGETGSSGKYTVKVCLSWLRPLEPIDNCPEIPDSSQIKES